MPTRRTEQILFAAGAVLIAAYFVILTRASFQVFFSQDDLMNVYRSWQPASLLVKANLTIRRLPPSVQGELTWAKRKRFRQNEPALVLPVMPRKSRSLTPDQNWPESVSGSDDRLHVLVCPPDLHRESLFPPSDPAPLANESLSLTYNQLQNWLEIILRNSAIP
jgi:hypothetical protein